MDIPSSGLEHTKVMFVGWVISLILKPLSHANTAIDDPDKEQLLSWGLPTSGQDDMKVRGICRKWPTTLHQDRRCTVS